VTSKRRVARRPIRTTARPAPEICVRVSSRPRRPPRCSAGSPKSTWVAEWKRPSRGFSSMAAAEVRADAFDGDMPLRSATLVESTLVDHRGFVVVLARPGGGSDGDPLGGRRSLVAGHIADVRPALARDPAAAGAAASGGLRATPHVDCAAARHGADGWPADGG